MLCNGYVVGSYKVVATNPLFYLIEVSRVDQKEDSIPKKSFQDARRKRRIVVNDEEESEVEVIQKYNGIQKGSIIDDDDDDDESKESENNDNESVDNQTNSNEDSENKHDNASIDNNDQAIELINDSNDPRDKFVWKDSKARVEPKKTTLYNLSGEELPSLIYSKESDNIAFVVVNGIVLSQNDPNLIVCYCEDNDGNFVIAPGCVDQFKLDQDSIQYKWLPPNKEHNPNDDFNSIFNNDEDNEGCELSSLPICSILSSLTLLPRYVKEQLMPNYSRSMRICDAYNHTTLRTSFKIHDYLEFYHIQASWIWRTILGEHITKNFLEPFEQFGTAKNNCLKIISHVMNAHKWNAKNILKKKGICNACNLPRTLGTLIDNMYFVGIDCKERLHYFYNIAKIIRNFRIHFDRDNLLTKMIQAQHVYQSYVSQRYYNQE